MDDETGRKKYGWQWDSSTFRAIFEEGFEEGLVQARVIQRRRFVYDLGTEKFGPPDATVAAQLDRIDDPATLMHLLRGVLSASTWHDLLATVSER